MTIEQKCEIYRMRLEGATLQECADKFGVSKECIINTIPNVGRGKQTYGESCVYPGLKKWMAENKCTSKELASRCAMTASHMSNILTNKRGIKKLTIDRILDATGLSYEEAFK